jgi:hypothetical protein
MYDLLRTSIDCDFTDIVESLLRGPMARFWPVGDRASCIAGQVSPPKESSSATFNNGLLFASWLMNKEKHSSKNRSNDRRRKHYEKGPHDGKSVVLVIQKQHYGSNWTREVHPNANYVTPKSGAYPMAKAFVAHVFSLSYAGRS